MAQLKPGTTIGGRNIVQELDSHKNDKVAHIDYAVASGTNTYTANIQGITALVEGLSVKIKFQNANTGASTLNINGLGAKEIRKSNGNTLSSGNIKAGQICHLVYTGSVFQILGEGGEYGTATPAEVLKGYTIGTEDGVKEGTLELTGNATTGDVLAGKTFYNTNAKSKQTGAMPNHGAKIITPSTVNQAIPAGYHNGQGYVEGDANLVKSNIRDGVTIFGIVGTYNPYNMAQSGGTSIYSKKWSSGSEHDRLRLELEMLLPGTLSFYYSADAGTYSSCSAYIKLNGVQYGRTVFASYGGSDNNTIDVPIAPGDIISFYTAISYIGSSSSDCIFSISCRRKMPAPALRVAYGD